MGNKIEKRTRGGFQKSKQPCWTCTKCYGDCSWSFDFTPVKGWKAKRTIKKDGLKSYKIEYCTEYEWDGTID